MIGGALVPASHCAETRRRLSAWVGFGWGLPENWVRNRGKGRVTAHFGSRGFATYQPRRGTGSPGGVAHGPRDMLFQ